MKLSFASKWKSVEGQKDPFGVGNSFAEISKARVRRSSFPGVEKALHKQQGQGFLPPAPAGVEQLTCSQHTASGAVLGKGATPVSLITMTCP